MTHLNEECPTCKGKWCECKPSVNKTYQNVSKLVKDVSKSLFLNGYKSAWLDTYLRKELKASVNQPCTYVFEAHPDCLCDTCIAFFKKHSVNQACTNDLCGKPLRCPECSDNQPRKNLCEKQINIIDKMGKIARKYDKPSVNVGCTNYNLSKRIVDKIAKDKSQTLSDKRKELFLLHRNIIPDAFSMLIEKQDKQFIIDLKVELNEANVFCDEIIDKLAGEDLI